MDALFADPVPPGLIYLGADIHGSLHSLKRPPGAKPGQTMLMRYDIFDPLPVAEPFDAVICRASIHHTPDPAKTFASLRSVLTSDGVLAISAYALKSRLRETMDDGLRAQIKPLPNDKALKVANELTQLARAIQQVPGKIEIGQDLEWLGIPKGSYGVHELIYDHMMKCWFNETFGEQYSDVVNFDWYHPTYAYRYRQDDLKTWFSRHSLDVIATASTKAQHYLEGVPRNNNSRVVPSTSQSDTTAP